MHTMNHDIIRVHRPPLKFSSLPNLIFCSGPPHNFFGLKFLDDPLKLGGEGGRGGRGLLPCLGFIFT